MSPYHPRGATSAPRALRLLLLGAMLAGACGGDHAEGGAPAVDVSHFQIIGSNCAGVAPVMTADDGQPRPAQSVLAHYYAVLELYRVLAEQRAVFQTDVPADLRGDVAYRTWQAKSVEILADVGETGRADRWYEGTFGMLGVGEASEVCERIDPEMYRRIGLLAHTGLLQAAQCGVNSDGDPRFWEVRPIALLQIGAVYDVDELVAAGLAGPPESDRDGPCLVWSSTRPGPTLDAGASGCSVAYREKAVTEAVVLDLFSDEEVAGVPILRRAFTARGEVALPNGLDSARRVLRSDQFASAVVLGRPEWAFAGTFVDQAGRTHHLVRLVGHRAGPLETPNSLLRDEERQQVEAMVGRWAERCCAGDCAPRLDGGLPSPDPSPSPDPGTGMDAGAGPDAGAPPLDGGVRPGGAAELARSLSDCSLACTPEGQCETGLITDGLVVVVTDRTIVECGGDCPHPAADPPAEEPACTE
jgi:hypothetical protein